MKILTALICFGLSTALAQTGDPKLIIRPGEEVRLAYPDGRVAVFYAKVEKRRLKSDLRMSRNTCTPVVAANCRAEFPYLYTTLALVWKSHPKRVGQFARDKVEGKLENFRFSFLDYPILGGTAEFTEEVSGYGSMKCDNYDFVPWSKPNPLYEAEILFWDEDFETGIHELKYFINGDPNSASAITGRYENIPLRYNGSIVVFGPSKSKPLREYFNLFHFAYSLQWTFAKPNIQNAADKLCRIKLDLNFGKLFEQFGDAFRASEPKNVSDFAPLVVGSEAYRLAQPQLESLPWQNQYQ